MYIELPCGCFGVTVGRRPVWACGDNTRFRLSTLKNKFSTAFSYDVPRGEIDLILVLNSTFSNISAISWRPVLVVDEGGVPGENHRPWTKQLVNFIVAMI
jgi:hypothetical protein